MDAKLETLIELYAAAEERYVDFIRAGADDAVLSAAKEEALLAADEVFSVNDDPETSVEDRQAAEAECHRIWYERFELGKEKD